MKGLLIVSLVFVLCGVGVVPLEVKNRKATAASGYVRVPDPGKLARTITVKCGSQDVEKRLYDFVPVDEEAWKSLGVGLPKEPNFVLVVVLPEHDRGDFDDSKVYIDANRNGWAEEVLSWDEAVERWDGSWCVAYEQVRKGRP